VKTVPGKTDRVVIVGAGLAGLSAALRLTGAGREVTVLEREAVPGGQPERRLQLRAHPRVGVLAGVGHAHPVAGVLQRGDDRGQLHHLGPGAERHQHVPAARHARTATGAHGSTTGLPSSLL